MGTQRPVPGRKRGPGPTTRRVGNWVLGEDILGSSDPRTQGFILRDETATSTTYAESDSDGTSTTYAESEGQ